MAGFIGPLPYDMKECQVRAEEIFSHVNKEVTINGLTYKNVVINCEIWKERPSIDEIFMKELENHGSP